MVDKCGCIRNFLDFDGLRNQEIHVEAEETKFCCAFWNGNHLNVFNLGLVMQHLNHNIRITHGILAQSNAMHVS